MKHQTSSFLISDEIAWQTTADKGVTRKILGYDDSIMVVRVHFESGAEGAMHSHPHSQSTYVASGRFELTIGDQKRILSAGDGYYVAPGLVHGCRCIDEGDLIDNFSPIREDFLK